LKVCGPLQIEDIIVIFQIFGLRFARLGALSAGSPEQVGHFDWRVGLDIRHLPPGKRNGISLSRRHGGFSQVSLFRFLDKVTRDTIFGLFSPANRSVFDAR